MIEHIAIEVKLAAGNAGSIAGYASLFGKPADLVNDVIAPGAFAATLREHKAAGTLPAMLREHVGDPVGAWLEVAEDELGLRVKGKIDLATAAGRAAYEAVVAGEIDGLSIGYRARKASRDEAGIRTLHDIDLIEISLVRRPAASRARVLAVKAASVANTAAKGAAPIPKGNAMAKTETAPGGDAGNEMTIDDRVTGLEETVSGMDTRLKSVEEAVAGVAKSAKSIELKLSRPGVIAEMKAEPVERKAFESYIRKGRDAMSSDEVKTLRVSDNAAGGFLAPPEFAAEILKNVVQFSPIRQFARVQTVASAEVRIPKRTGTMTAAWVGEIAARSGTEPAYGQIALTPHEVACYVDISNALLEDAQIDMGAELAIDGAEEFGRIEGSAFVKGDGTGKPKGILTDDTVTGFASGTAATLGTAPADTLVKMLYKLAPFYRANAVWGLNANTLAEVRLLKDSTGRFLWQEGLAAGQPGTLLGRPVVELPDMDDVGANKFPIILGDFRQGYRIIDRVSLSVLRDPFSQATSGITRFHMRRRVGGGVVKGEAIVRLKCATAL